jgi:hypothetical protein
MLHPRLTPVGATIGGSSSALLATIGPTGAWTDLSFLTRWGDGACGMYEASWTMPLPPGYSHPLLRRGTIVELMDGNYRVGSPMVMSEPAVGTGYDDPWQITCTGIGREVEGDSSWYAWDGSLNSTTVPSTAIDQAIVRGLRWAGRAASVSTSAYGATTTAEQPNTIGSLLNAASIGANKRWGVGQDNIVGFFDDPTTPTYHVTPGAAALGTADDNYASVVYVRYVSSSTGTYATAFSPSSAPAVETRFARREFTTDAPVKLGPISSASAQAVADGIYAKAKGRLAWTNSLTLNSNEILLSGQPASLSKVAEDVGNGCMVRLYGTFSDLLETNGQTWLDIIVGQAKYVDGAQTIDLDPLGLAARDLSAIVEEVSGVSDAA